MDKITFLRELEQQLQEIPSEERQEAITYYENYFEDAGIEKEADVLQELGSPQEVAKNILADFLEAKTDKTDTLPMPVCPDTQSSFSKEELLQARQGNTAEEKKNGTSAEKGDTSKILLISILLLFTAPVWIGVLLGAVGTLAGLFLAAAALVVGFAVSFGICAIAGIAVFVFGVIRLFTVTMEGFIAMGGGLITFGIGILFLLAMLLCVWIVKQMAKGLVWLCNTLFHKRGATV